MSSDRKEQDLLGTKHLPKDALYGIHSLRAAQNFPISMKKVHPKLIHAYGSVKLAALCTNEELGYFPDAKVFEAIKKATEELRAGELDDHIIVDALQGGAGTSTNMNINEVIANRALQILGHNPGEYDYIDPIDHINLHQSTNDTYPTALKVAGLEMLKDLEHELIRLVDAFQSKEKEMAHVVKVGRTQLQDAVLTTLGREMGAYADAFSRDRWRVQKCEERLRVVNLGGTAIGTGIGAPKFYIFRVVDRLRDLTNLNVCRAENLIDATQNLDPIVETSGIIRTVASNLLKIANDFRMMASGPQAGLQELSLEKRQAGSSIMPGKVNPVIPEAIVQGALNVLANDQTVTLASSMGNLELNHLFPLIADKFLESMQIMIQCCQIFTDYCVKSVKANEKECKTQVDKSEATAVSLIEKIGYHEVEKISQEAQKASSTIKEVALSKEIVTEEEYSEIISAENVTKLGFNSRRKRR